MSLYDDLDGDRASAPSSGGGGAPQIATQVVTNAGAGWSPGIRLLQTHLKAKRALNTTAAQATRRERRPPPVALDLNNGKSRRSPPPPPPPPPAPTPASASSRKKDDWNVVGEYDPMWPNDYDKMLKEMRDRRERDDDDLDDKDRKGSRKRKSRFGDEDDSSDKLTRLQPDEEVEVSLQPQPPRSGGAAIAPPPSLRESDPPSPPRGGGGGGGGFEKPPERLVASAASSPANFVGNSVAAKIMAKYGFKEGQGLGKKEQGMSMALQVEKTSKRGGRIIHEKDGAVLFPPPGEFPRPASPGEFAAQSKSEPSITEILKNPSKVVLLRNMVGPGDVDEDLEPEVKDECHTKYGDVIKVVIYEIPEVAADEAVRIFVEFKRIESAIKAVVDLNGRFFGGRQVKAGFYSVDHFANLQLLH